MKITSLPNYQITSRIYESANSLVCRGLRDKDSLPVILKILKEDYPSPEELTRYRREYDITRSLADSEGVVRAHSLERHRNTLVTCLEDFGGESLKHWLTEHRLSLAEQLTLAIRATEILGQIHHQNIIHKDINPANLVFNPTTGVLKIIDFGISTQLSRQHLTLRNPDVLEGTLAYMSPEQTGRMNRALDYRTDLYSLGATFYELFTGRVPFESEDAMELVHCHIARQPTPPHHISPELPGAILTLFSDYWKKQRRHVIRVPGVSEPICRNAGTPCSEPARLNPLPWPKKTFQTVFRFPKNFMGANMRQTLCFLPLNRWLPEKRKSCWLPAIPVLANWHWSKRFTNRSLKNRAISFRANLTSSIVIFPTVRLSMLLKNWSDNC